jgi:hypothetical protein
VPVCVRISLSLSVLWRCGELAYVFCHVRVNQRADILAFSKVCVSVCVCVCVFVRLSFSVFPQHPPDNQHFLSVSLCLSASLSLPLSVCLSLTHTGGAVRRKGTRAADIRASSRV